MTDQATASARVATTAADRYAKQLASHLGRRSEVRNTTDGTVIVLTNGECRVVSRPECLELHASAPTRDELERVMEVVGRHLERFGQRSELTVVWE
jgi:uncharacterized protein